MLLSAAAFGQTPTATYSFTRSGENISECDCKTQMPKELWAHIVIPDEAYNFDKVTFCINGLGNPDVNQPYKDKKGENFPGYVGDWTFTREQLEQKYPEKGQTVDFLLLDPSNAANEYKGAAYITQRTLCYYGLADQYSIRVSIIGYTKLGTRQVWVSRYTDGTGGGWWETVTDYDGGTFIVKAPEMMTIKQDTQKRDDEAKKFKKKGRRALIIGAAILVPLIIFAKMQDMKKPE